MAYNGGMAEYSRAEPLPAWVARPTPAHTLTDAAEAARRSVRRFAEVRRRERYAATLPPLLTTPLPQPWQLVSLDALSGAPATWAHKAVALGADVKAVRAGTAVMLIVRAPRIRATWVDGHTTGVTGLGRKLTLAQALEAIESAHGPR